LSDRFDLLATAFSLLALSAAVAYVQRPRIATLATLLACLLLAFAGKEIAIVGALAACTLIVLPNRDWPLAARSAGPVAAVLLLVVAWLGYRAALMTNPQSSLLRLIRLPRHSPGALPYGSVSARAISSVHAALAQLELPSRRRQIYLLDATSLWGFAGSGDATVKATTPDLGRLEHCLVLTERTPWGSFMRTGSLQDFSPLRALTNEGKPVPWLVLGDFFAGLSQPRCRHRRAFDRRRDLPRLP